jgi:hypothetical protein
MNNLLALHLLLLLTAPTAGFATPTPTPEGILTPPPSPGPTPRVEIPLEFYFRRPAKILPVAESENIEVVEENPWLTQEDFTEARVIPKNDRYSLRIDLTPAGKMKFREAMMGNVGRVVIFSVDNVARGEYEMVPVRRKDRIYVKGDFTLPEAEQIVGWINYRPSPTPSPPPSPLPTPPIF